MKKNNVLITGGAGYLGSILTELLLDEGYKVTVLDNLIYKQTSLLHLCSNTNFKFIKGDVIDLNLLKKLIPEYNIIIPLAAIVGAPACDSNTDLAIRVNYTQIQVIVDILRKDQKLIMPNTNSQYGSSKDVITEESPFNPLSLYAKTKCDAEEYILDWGNGICLRLATVFGASSRMRTDLLVNDFVHKTIELGYLVLFQSHYKRNYIHVRDIAYTFLFCIENYDKMNNNVFNVGLSDTNLSKLELAEKIKEHFPDLVIVENEFKTDFDNRNYVVSNKKLESFGWKPKYTIDDGIKELVDVYKMIITHNNRNFTNL
jgi:nucleoside-diphosphate-sugar epimerase|tara:strand:+ start:1429 stop:2373 length:945 start_codon:yes stop_codon:yes gene_type:complete